MAASSRAAPLALLALALLCQPCPATADADCGAEEPEDESALLQADAVAHRAAEAALLAHRSAGAGAGDHVQRAKDMDKAAAGKAPPKQCGAIWIADSWTCCLDAMGNGIGGAPGSTCCQSPVTGGVLICGAGSVCNPKSGLCFAPGSDMCGDVACAPGTECVAPGVCVIPGTTDGQKRCGAIFINEKWTCCTDAHGNGIGAAPGSTCCLSPRSGGVVACGAGSVCNPNSGLCFEPGSEVCGDVACAPGTVCAGYGICLVPGMPGTELGGPEGSEGNSTSSEGNSTSLESNSTAE